MAVLSLLLPSLVGALAACANPSAKELAVKAKDEHPDVKEASEEIHAAAALTNAVTFRMGAALPGWRDLSTAGNSANLVSRTDVPARGPSASDPVVSGFQLELKAPVGAAHIEQSVAITGEVNISAWFKDELPTVNAGTLFFIRKTDGDADSTGIGIFPTIPGEYAIRVNRSATISSGVKRSPGWRRFDIVITSGGAYYRIDGQLVYSGNSPLQNAAYTSAAAIGFIAAWGVTGTINYAGLAVTPAKTDSWKAQMKRELAEFYETYANTQFQISDLGNRLHGNDLRTLIDTANAFYAHGLNANDATAKAKAVSLLRTGLNARWGSGDNLTQGRYWAQGALSGTLTLAYKLMGASKAVNSPDGADYAAKLKSIIIRQADSYILANDSYDSAIPGQKSIVGAGNAVVSDPLVAYGGKSSVRLSFTNASATNHVALIRPLPIMPLAPARKVSIRFYDDMDSSMATLFSAKSSAGSIILTAIGVNTTISASYYVLRFNDFAGTVATSVKRTPGWYLFEVYLQDDTSKGAFAAIDGKPVTDASGRIRYNTAQKSLNEVMLISSWGLASNARFA